MWISIFAIALAAAISFCIAAIALQPKPGRGRRGGALIRQTSDAPPTRAPQSPQLSAQEYAAGENAPRPVSSSLPEHLRQHYRPVLNEPIPAHLTALVRRLENITLP